MSRLSGMTASAAWDIGDLASGAEASTTISVPEAQMGDFVLVSSDIDLEEGNLYGQVSAAGTVEVVYINSAEDPSDLASMTVRVKVIPSDVI
jgi:hypothetical protein